MEQQSKNLGISIEVVRAIKSVPEKDWTGFFKIMRQLQLDRVEGAETQINLLEIQASIKQTTVIESFFQSLRNQQ